jgi:hypothetical protein
MKRQNISIKTSTCDMKSITGKFFKLFVFFFAAIPIVNCGCKKAYNPKMVASANNYLVVEGVINTGTDSSVIKLSRTVPVSSKTSKMPELGASITIISDANISYPVVEKGNGVYMGAIINSHSTAKYSLKIFTKDGKSYQSDFVPAKNSPPIDSVYYKALPNALNIYADTHDVTGNSRYYRWDFADTYVFNSAFYSSGYHAKVPSDTVLDRPVSDQIYQCWRSDTSSNILINSSAKLTNDVISGNLVISIPSNSEKLGHRYSILVNQYILTSGAYYYYQQLKKNTEQIGSIFDPQPSELPGNIHCISDPSEVVIGYITAGAPSAIRIYINSQDLRGYFAESPYSGCLLDTALYKQPLFGGGTINTVAEKIYSGLDIPVSPIAPPGGAVIGWSCSSPTCVDCTLRGTNKPPSWWISSF